MKEKNKITTDRPEAYPKQTEEDKQMKNQDEFIEPKKPADEKKDETYINPEKNSEDKSY